MDSELRKTSSLRKNEPGTLNLELFKATIQRIKVSNREDKIEEISKLFSLDGLITHYKNKTTQRVIVSANLTFEYLHEYHTSKKLTEVNYDVIFVPKGYFKRSEKKFDVFLSRRHILLEAELKCVTTEHPDNIARRIKQGSDQCSRIILDIHSEIQKRILIEGLKTGCVRNDIVKEILLFYNSRFYFLPKTLVLSKKIFDTIK